MRIKFFSFISVLVLFCSLLVSTVSAISKDQKAVYEKGIYYYDIATCDPANANTGSEPSPPQTDNEKVYILGDSITVIAESTYKKKLSDDGWDVTINGLSSRHITDSPPSPSSLDQIKKDESKIKEAAAIVIALGTNDSSNSESAIKSDVGKVLDKMKALNESASIYWVNMIDTRYESNTNKTNKAIDSAITSASRDSKNFSVIDWYSEAKTSKTLGSFDMGVHPTKQADIDLLVDLVGKSIKSSSPKYGAAKEVSSNCSCSNSGDIVVSGKDNAAKIMNYLIAPERGLTIAQAAGILGNFSQETGGTFNPKIVQGSPPTYSDTMKVDGVTGYGLAQWTYITRQQNLKKWAQKMNKKESDLTVQLSFLWHEMQGGTAKGIKAIKGDDVTVAKKSAHYFHAVFENSADDTAGIKEREDDAVKLMNQLKGSANPNASASSKSDCSDQEDGVSTKYKKISFKDLDDLRRQILESKNIKFGNYGSASSQKADIKGCLKSNALVGMLAMAEQSGVNIPINALGTDHGGCSGGKSLHNVGLAIDIGYYGNGDPQHNENGDKLYNFLYSNREDLVIDELIWQNPPSGKKCIGDAKVVDCLSFYGADTMNQHHHHIHVGFKAGGQ